MSEEIEGQIAPEKKRLDIKKLDCFFDTIAVFNTVNIYHTFTL